MRVEIEVSTNLDSHKLGRLIYEEIKDYLDAVMDRHAIVKFREFDDAEEMSAYINAVVEELATQFKHVVIVRVHELSGEEPNGYGSAIIVGTNDENEVGTIKEMASIGTSVRET